MPRGTLLEHANPPIDLRLRGVADAPRSGGGPHPPIAPPPSDLGAVLTVCYSALSHRVADIRPPEDPTVDVVVLVQGDDVPVDLPRRIRVVRLGTTGVARSRNAALEVARRRYLLFADDDVRVDLGGVLEAVRRLRRSGDAIALGRATDPSGRLRKRYQRDGTALTLYNTAKAATYELLVDVHQVRAHGIRFDERFGAGADHYLGDEYVFVADARRAGLRGTAVARVFGTHPEVSSGVGWGTDADRRARALVFNRVFGRRAPAVRAAFALRHLPRMGPAAAARFVVDGSRPLNGSTRPDRPAIRLLPPRVGETGSGSATGRLRA